MCYTIVTTTDEAPFTAVLCHIAPTVGTVGVFYFIRLRINPVSP